MVGQNEIEIHKKLLAEAEEALKVEQSRMDNLRAALLEAKKKVFEKMEQGHWDDAQTALLQAKVLHIRWSTAEASLDNASSRVTTLKTALKREQERGPVVPYQPYQSASPAQEKKAEEPKVDPYKPEP